MKALAKEPAARYQNCRELLEDLHNYRNLAAAANPNATLPIGGLPTNNLSPAAPENGQIAATSRSLNARATSPSQTPVVRRTGVIAPAPQPKKSNAFATVLAAIFLLGVIVFGFQKIRPVFQAARQQTQTTKATREPARTGTAAEPNSPEKSNGDSTVSSAPTETATDPNPLPVAAKVSAVTANHVAAAPANSLAASPAH